MRIIYQSTLPRSIMWTKFMALPPPLHWLMCGLPLAKTPPCQLPAAGCGTSCKSPVTSLEITDSMLCSPLKGLIPPRILAPPLVSELSVGAMPERWRATLPTACSSVMLYIWMPGTDSFWGVLGFFQNRCCKRWGALGFCRLCSQKKV